MPYPPGRCSGELAGVRHVAMNLLSNEKTLKAGIKRKHLKAALSPDYCPESLRGKHFRNLALVLHIGDRLFYKPCSKQRLKRNRNDNN